MRKIIWVFMFIIVSLLVACDPQEVVDEKVVATVASENLNGYMLVVDVEVEGKVTSMAMLKETITQVSNGIYAKYQAQFGTETYTLIFNVYKDMESEDSPFYGSIGYKVNASIDMPGLSLIKNNLKF